MMPESLARLKSLAGDDLVGVGGLADRGAVSKQDPSRRTRGVADCETDWTKVGRSG